MVDFWLINIEFSVLTGKYDFFFNVTGIAKTYLTLI